MTTPLDHPTPSKPQATVSVHLDAMELLFSRSPRVTGRRSTTAPRN
jgi:hypothetical protein